jgi:hypothetical protein
MNYLNHYKNLIVNAKTRTLDKTIKVEKHHILPKSLKTNLHCINTLNTLLSDVNNLDERIKLTLREHFVAHKLLIKIFEPNSVYHNKNCLIKMIYACDMMRKRKTNIIINNSRDFEWIKQKFDEYCHGENHPNFGIIRSDEFKKNMSKIKKNMTIETKIKMSKSKKGSCLSDTHKKSISESCKNSDKCKSNHYHKSVIQYDKQMNFIKEFDSIKIAIIETNSPAVGGCCNGKLKTSGGFIWKFKNQEIYEN